MTANYLELLAMGDHCTSLNTGTREYHPRLSFPFKQIARDHKTKRTDINTSSNRQMATFLDQSRLEAITFHSMQIMRGHLKYKT